MTLSVSLPPGMTCDVAVLAVGFVVLHDANPLGLSCSFSIERRDGRTMFLVECPPELRPLVEAQLYAAAPAARIEPAETSSVRVRDEWHVPLHLVTDGAARTDVAVQSAAADPLAIVLAVLERLPTEAVTRVSFQVRPSTTRDRRRAAALGRRVARMRAIFPGDALRRLLYRRAPMGLGGRLLLDAMIASAASVVPRQRRAGDRQRVEARPDEPLFQTGIVVQTSGCRDARAARHVLRELVGAFAPFARVCGTFAPGRPRRGRPGGIRSGLLAPADLAALWHLPAADRETAGVPAATHRDLEPPAWLPAPGAAADLTVLGEAIFRGTARLCGLASDDRLRHLVVLGKTGTGKSTLLEQLIASDIARGQGVGLVDPHGELCESAAAAVPRRRTNDVVLFDAADVSHPVGFNPLRCDRVADRPLVASGVLAAFKKLYPDFFGPRMEHVFRNALLACVATPGLTFVHLQRFLCDPPFRRQVVERGDDPVVRQFWLKEFSAMPQKLQAEAVAPVQNKVGAFVSHPVLRHVLGQPDARLDLRRVMDEGKILLCSVSKGRIGDDGAALLGSLVVTSVQLAAMSRADVPEAERRAFALVVDEVGSFATDGLAAMLSESRKYRTSLTAAFQHVSQLSPATQDALFGNAGSLLAFQCGADDAAYLAGQLGPGVTPQDLLNVPRYHAYARLLVDGRPTPPFTLRTIPPAKRPHDPLRLDAVRRASRRRYAKASAAVAAEVRAATLAA